MPFVEPTGHLLNGGALSFAEEFDFVLISGTVRRRAIFDDPFFDPQAGQVVVSTRQPVLSATEETFAGLERGLTVTRVKTGKSYSVLEVRPDGTGWAYVDLAVE